MANALERRFQIAQSQLKKQESARQMQEERAMRRQFAQAGALGSGAAIKSSMESRARGAQRLQSGMLALESEKLGQQYQEEQTEKQRGFLASESQKGRLFSAGESQKGRLFSAGESQKERSFKASESKAGRLFSAGESQKDRLFSAGESQKERSFKASESKAGRQFAAGEASKSREADWKKFSASLDFEEGQAEIANTLAQAEFDINKFVTLENLNTARRSLGLDPLEDFSREKKPSTTWDGSRQGSIINTLSKREIAGLATGVPWSWNNQTNRRVVNIGGRSVELSADEYRDIVNYYRKTAY